MKNIHLVLAGESRLSLNRSYRDYAIGTEVSKPYWIYSQYKHHMSVTDASVRPHNIYITSNEEIKEGDWCYQTELPNLLERCKGKEENWMINRGFKKIILTTDQDLIKDGVQAIDDEFLEWFVKNSSCEEVEVIYGLYNPMGRKVSSEKVSENHSQCIWKHKIIIPKEEPKQHLTDIMKQDEELGLYEQTKCYCGHTTTCDCVPEEPKQENINALDFEVNALKREIKVLKHQQERSYSEEKVLPLLEMLQKCKEYFLLKTDKYSDERADAIIDVMEQFKKK